MSERLMSVTALVVVVSFLGCLLIAGIVQVTSWTVVRLIVAHVMAAAVFGTLVGIVWEYFFHGAQALRSRLVGGMLLLGLFGAASLTYVRLEALQVASSAGEQTIQRFLPLLVVMATIERGRVIVRKKRKSHLS